MNYLEPAPLSPLSGEGRTNFHAQHAAESEDLNLMDIDTDMIDLIEGPDLRVSTAPTLTLTSSETITAQDRLELNYVVEDTVPSRKSPDTSTPGPSDESQEPPLSPLTTAAQTETRPSNYEAHSGAVQITTSRSADPSAVPVSVSKSVDPSTVTDDPGGCRTLDGRMNILYLT